MRLRGELEKGKRRMEYILSEFDREHIEGWKRMKEEIKRLNWNEVPLVTADDFTSSLIFLPPAKPENR